jgi:hypothetical protein
VGFGGGWRRLSPPPLPFRGLFGAWIALGLASLVHALDRKYSAGEMQTEVLYSILMFVVFFAITDRRWLERFRRVVFAATALSFASIGLWWFSDRASSTYAFYNGPGLYSTYLVAVFPFVLLWTIGRDVAPRERWWSATLLAGVLVAGAVSLNRAFWIVAALQTASRAAGSRARAIACSRARSRWRCSRPGCT